MTASFDNDDWVWVVVQDPGGDEQYLGQQAEGGAAFIPMFAKKDHALMCMHLMTRDKRKKYEVQAVIYSDLKDQAATSGFLLFLLDEEGRVLDKIDPA